MEHNSRNTIVSVAGWSAIVGSLTMVLGAALWGTSGTDLWAALDAGDMAGYLADSAAVQGQLIANLTVWIVGVLVFGVAGAGMARISRGRPATAEMALACYRIGVPVVVVSYIAMLSLVVLLAGDASAVEVVVAEVVGWIAARADDLATALILGFGPFFLALAGRGDWMPAWLASWGYAAGAVGLFSLVVLYVPPMRPAAFVIIPFGVLWTIAAGVVLVRSGGRGAAR